MDRSGPAVAFSAPWFDEAERNRVLDALRGRIAGDGPFCRRVEERLARLLGAKRVLLTTSCTHALELALLALGIGHGQEVVCPSFTFVSTANAILRVGARPVFADIEDRSLGLDPRDLERRLSPLTAAVLPVHYAGVAPDMDSILGLARGRGLRVVEDAAQALGASFRGKALGTLGDAGCLSFHETKNITCGEGGALVLDDAETAARAEIIREKGTNRSAFLRGEVDKYTWVAEGSSYILSEVLAALLDAQLDKFAEIQARRAKAATRYQAGLETWARSRGVRLPAPIPERQSNHHIFYLLFPDEAGRDACLQALRARGVMASFHYVPLHSSPHGRALGLDRGDLPVTERVARTLLRLPLHPLLADEDIDRVVAAVVASSA
ncbi:MAG TPA: dTDP-4-amino-4,6-dideoxygalactose transaminase [Vicinamibacteria bacterium]|nr:dTDP-4-amino-4,6-dideoxygalactose transaminase [Vicinamibacteria bacterium]